MNPRVNQVRVALVGYQPGDRVLVYRDTKSHLGIFKDYGGRFPARLPQPGIILEGFLSNDRFPVAFDELPKRSGHETGSWWVHPEDMRLE